MTRNQPNKYWTTYDQANNNFQNLNTEDANVHWDNGAEFTSQVMDLWAYSNGVKIDFSRPGKPTDNAFVESFNGTFRAECLDAHWFQNLADAKQIIETWRREYNESRPHRALANRTPEEFASQIAASRDLTEPKTSRFLTL